MASQQSESSSNKWHKNYTRLMPYYYVNKKAKLTSSDIGEKIVRVRKVIKSKKELIIEVAEKIDQEKDLKAKGSKNRRKRLVESSLTASWDDLEEISYQAIKTNRWSLSFLR
ncbi:MAG: hypothetical protein ACC656_08430 [Candidatus Heimdallarchaeota archaeon]